MSNGAHLPPVSSWFTLTRDQVLDKFMSLKDAYTDGKGNKRFVWIPGTRTDRALIVAHADTVWGSLPIEMGFYNGILYSKNRLLEYKYKNKWNHECTKFGVGLGADDRAGCAMAWELRNSGHSILITTGEEIGCVAAKRMMTNEWWRKTLNDHTFAIELDRRGHKDIVFYDIGTNAFANFMKKETGYTPAQGFGTDIKEICRDICGVNISVGYYEEHTAEEKLVVDQWMNTLHTVKTLLGKKDLPQFKLDRTDKFELWKQEVKTYPVNNTQPVSGSSSATNFRNTASSRSQELDSDTEWEDYYRTTVAHPSDFARGVGRKSYLTTEDGLVETKVEKKKNEDAPIRYMTCRNNSCLNRITDKEWFENHFKCPKCHVDL